VKKFVFSDFEKMNISSKKNQSNSLYLFFLRGIIEVLNMISGHFHFYSISGYFSDEKES
jgi:hypothetical protein